MTVRTWWQRLCARPRPELLCRHPEDKRIRAGSMGHPRRWICRQCGHVGE